MRTAPPFAVHRLWLDRPVAPQPAGVPWHRRSRATGQHQRARTLRKRCRRIGPAYTAARWSNCTPMPLTPGRAKLPPYSSCTGCIRKPSRRKRFTIGCCIAATVRCSHPGPMRSDRESSRRTPACCWPAMPSGSICPWHSWSARRPQVGSPPTGYWRDGGWPVTHCTRSPPKDGHRCCDGWPIAKVRVDHEGQEGVGRDTFCLERHGQISARRIAMRSLPSSTPRWREPSADPPATGTHSPQAEPCDPVSRSAHASPASMSSPGVTVRTGCASVPAIARTWAPTWPPP